MEVGHELIVITWFHQAKCDVLKGHPRSDESHAIRESRIAKTGAGCCNTIIVPQQLALYVTHV